MEMKCSGIVEKGDQIARHYGYPTANVWLYGDDRCNKESCHDGTWAGRVQHGESRYNAAVYCTDEKNRCRIEAHLFGFSGELVGDRLEIEFLERISGPVPFEGEVQMQKKIDGDIRLVREYFENKD